MKNWAIWQFVKNVFDFSNWANINVLEQMSKIFFIVVIISFVLSIIGLICKIVSLVIKIVGFFKK